jgi:hypothetical protein
MTHRWQEEEEDDAPHKEEEAEERPLFVWLPPHVESSRLPQTPEMMRALAHAALALGVCAVCVWLGLFVGLCVLLAYANTEAVHHACAGFWDCMLAATVAPALVPLLYCALGPCLLVGWRPFSAGCAAVMAVVSLSATLTASQSPACVDALRAPSLPLLLYVGFIKGGLFAALAVAGVTR